MGKWESGRVGEWESGRGGVASLAQTAEHYFFILTSSMGFQCLTIC